MTNKVACENTKPGTPPADWQTQGAGDPSIQGFATAMSVQPGDRVDFKIKSSAASYHLDILRLGYYGGNGARKLAAGIRPSATLPQSQPACLTQASTGLVDCGNWAVSASWTVPTDAVSGVYIAHLVRDDTGGDSQIPFVVRDDTSHSDVLLQTSDATWEAYNAYGGNSLYGCTVACPPGNPYAYKAAFAVSYNRPFDGAVNDQWRSYLYYAEYSLIRFLERNGYDVSYTSQVDVDRSAAPLLNHKVFISSAHDEYWSAAARAHVEAARDAGVNLAFFTGNEVFWKTRLGASIDGHATPSRTLITYKDTHFDDPASQDPVAWTGTWRDPRFSPPKDGGRPENALTGQYFLVNSGTADITVPGSFAPLRFWRNTAVTALAANQTRTLAAGAGMLGYEWDVDADNGFRPPGLFHLSSTTVTGTEAFKDFGSATVSPSPAITHNLAMYRAPSGALVFGAGTVQWAWGLDTTNVWARPGPPSQPPDPVVQQATVNLLADMHSQPATLMTGLTATTASTDRSPPTSSIASPAPGAVVADGTRTTISGTAADAGGVVAGVEVSTDGGASWHPATGTSNWTYSWVAHGYPAATIRTRAVDDSGHLETPSAGVAVGVTCPCSLLGDTTPSTADSGDASAVEVGMKFKADVDGSVTGVRFYKSALNTGTHVGNLWDASGNRLASATFTSETATGWQKVTFASPVAVTAGTTYVVSYFAPKGHYSEMTGFFFSPSPQGGTSIDSLPLHAISGNGNGPDGGNGLYGYGASSTFPTGSFAGENYWVDVLFAPAVPPGAVGNVSATPGTGSATVTWTAPSSGGPPASYKITPYLGATAQPAKTVTGSPPATQATVSGLTAGQAYTFTVQAANGSGSGPVSANSNAVIPAAPTAPGAPTGVGAVSPGASSVQVSWTAPSGDGGSALTGYSVRPYIGTVAQPAVDVDPTSTTTRIGGLDPDTTYTFTVVARNAIGSSPESAPSGPVIPAAFTTIFAPSATPSVVDSRDGNAVELGVAFRSDVVGRITGVRFYKAAANTGTHVGSLWTAGGTRLATATFTGESASGWQQANFATPVRISANTTYVASYYAPAGHYSATSQGLATTVDNPPLHALANSVTPNGVYAYGGASAFPISSFNATDYGVDVVFTPAPAKPPGAVDAPTATAGRESASVAWAAPATGGEPTTYTVTPHAGSAALPATTVNAPTTTATVGGLAAGTSYTFTVAASNGYGTGPDSAPSAAVTPLATTAPTAPGTPSATAAGNGAASVSWSAPASDGGAPLTGYVVTPYIGLFPQAAVTVGPSLLSARITGLADGTTYTFRVRATNAVGAGPESADSAPVTPQATVHGSQTPPIVDAGDPNGVELGMKFRADVAGQVLGIRFYKAAGNTGTHVGSLWDSSGNRLATVTFANESPAGWQQATLATPVSIAAGATYVVSYHAPNGHYSDTPQGFASAIDAPPLHGLATSASANGVFAYGATSTFPQDTWNASDYWVDVAFAEQAT